ncbi:hypothetical protein FQN52_006804 [Onygenales sp. PD_12]|nr:hypothetical protein FQN52_006804 [Onygenales sp. PD_12]
MLKLLRPLGMAHKIPTEPLIAVIGSTGTGKSQLAVDIANRFNGEIINGDAMQMYRGLPIITNQITPEERNGIPHHLLGCIGLDEEPWRVSRFKKECLKTIKEIRSRGKLPVLVGGTHYYTHSVLFNEAILDSEGESGEGETQDGQGNGKNDDGAPKLSSEEEFPILNASPEEILAKLREVDPVMANRWHPNETRKIRRSLEIYLQTGRPASEVYKEQSNLIQAASNSTPSPSPSPTPTPIPNPQAPDQPSSAAVTAGQLRFPTLIFWTHTDQQTLTARLNRRVDIMAAAGLLAEAQVLYDHLHAQEAAGNTVDRTRGIWVSIGFKELEPYFRALHNPHATWARLQDIKGICLDAIKTATRQYAKQQIKWIRGKLWNALGTARATGMLFVVDSSRGGSGSVWREDVLGPAERVVEKFLKGEECPDPMSLSESAREVFETQLMRKGAAAAGGEGGGQVMKGLERQCRTCEVCKVTVQSEEQWEMHVRGSRHKRVVRARRKWEEKEKYFGVLGDGGQGEKAGGDAETGTGTTERGR